MTAYYNEIDPFAAEWLRQLIKHGHIAPGEVDERDIRDVLPSDLRGFDQCHFFAGIGGWSYALRLAGWPDDRPVWTGSCPCQPFSQAGKGGGTFDERHLWPAFHHLLAIQQPGVVFGEQVASKDGLAWLDLVQTDLEGTGYTSAAVDICAAGLGAPHIRQRLWFVAERLADSKRDGQHRSRDARQGRRDESSDGGAIVRLADASAERELSGREHGCEQADRGPVREGYQGAQSDLAGYRPGPTNGFWRDVDWLGCRDGKWRPVESFDGKMADELSDRLGYRRIGDRYSLDPLIQKTQNRVGRLRGYGNAIAPQVAAQFIEAYMQ